MRRVRPYFFCVLPLLIALLIRSFAAARPDITERFFSRGVYPPIALFCSRITGVFPFSVVEVLLVFFCVCLVYFCIRRSFLRALALLCAVACVFLFGWSLNYFRQPLEATLSLPVRPSEKWELVALCEELIADVNARYAEPPADPLAHVTDALNAAASSWPIPEGPYAAPKTALASGLLSRLMIEGIASPFTAEALVNGGIPAVSLPFAACHEAAHVRGFAREEDAHLVAYLACEASQTPYFRYSGAASALLYALRALSDADAEAYQALYETLSDPVRADLSNRAAYWANYRQQPAAEVGARLNNAYLETMGGGDQSAKSYGRIVDLLLALKRKGDNP